MSNSPDTLTRIELGAGMVKKIFGHIDSALHVAHLSKIYGLLRTKNVPNTDVLEFTSTVPGSIYIVTHPVGYNQWPKGGLDAYTALICVLNTLKVLVFLSHGWCLTS